MRYHKEKIWEVGNGGSLILPNETGIHIVN